MQFNKKLILIALILIGAGAVILGVAFAVTGFNPGALSTDEYVTNEYEIKDDFDGISVKGTTEIITFLKSDSSVCKVVCVEKTNDLHAVKVESGTLYVEKKQEGFRWNISFGVNMQSSSITVYLPKNDYDKLFIDSDTGDVTLPSDFTFESVSIKLDTGDVDIASSVKGIADIETDTGLINMHDMSAGSIELSTGTGRNNLTKVACAGRLELDTDTGRTELDDVTCSDLHSKGSTSDLKLTGVTASGEFRIERDTGSVEFDGSDAEAIYVKTDTGDVTGSILTDKVFFTETETGKVDVPKTITGGRCEIETDTGDITITVP